MKKIFPLFIFLVLFLFSLPSSYLSASETSEPFVCNGSDETYEEVFGYDRICKKDGVWYGILKITDRELITVETTGKDPENMLYISFSRNLKELTSIVLEYETETSCVYFNTPFGCFLGEEVSSVKDTIVVDNIQSLPETLDNFLFGDVLSIDSYDGDDPFVNYEYDYRITVSNPVKFKSVNILEFYYVLTNAEVDAINGDIQAQYDREVDYILHDGGLSLESKQLALDILNQEYSSYTIEYDEEINSLCLENNCYVENSVSQDENNFFPSLADFLKIGSFKELMLNILRISLFVGVAVIFILMFGKDAIKLFINSLYSIIETLGTILYHLIGKPILNILEMLVRIFVRGLGGRY